jgi:hypothetical protein
MATIGALESACPCCSRRERACRRRAMPVAVRHTISQTRSFSSRSPAPALTTQVPSQRNGTAAPLSICHSRQNPQSPKSQNIRHTYVSMWSWRLEPSAARPTRRRGVGGGRAAAAAAHGRGRTGRESLLIALGHASPGHCAALKTQDSRWTHAARAGRAAAATLLPDCT